MKLSISGKEVVATPELIQKVTHDQNFRNEFFILINEDSENSFIQATGTNEDLQVEYRDGASDDDHYICISSMSCGELEQLCLSYLKGDSQVLHNYEWCSLTNYKPPSVDTGSVGGWSFSGL